MNTSEPFKGKAALRVNRKTAGAAVSVADLFSSADCQVGTGMGADLKPALATWAGARDDNWIR